MSRLDIHKKLEYHRIKDESKQSTHVSLINPKGKYGMYRGDMDSFFDIYCDVIAKNSDANIGIAEKPTDQLPVLVDIDIKLDYFEEYIEGQKIIKDKHILTVVSIYQKVLKTIIQDCKDEDLNCFVLEKPSYKVSNDNGDYIKNGFHLHFPSIFMNGPDHEAYLLPRIEKELDLNRVFKDLGFEKSSKLLDKCYIKTPWLLYGSKKDVNMKPYKLTKIIDCEGDEIDLETALQNYSIFNCTENLINIQGKEEYYLPRVLSTILYNRSHYGIKPSITSVIKENAPKNPEYKRKTFKQLETTEAMEKARALVELMSEERAESRNDWMTVGWALYNLSDGSDEGLDVWMEFSLKCPDKFDENVCISQWEKMKKGEVGMGTLHYFAKEDNPSEYNKYLEENMKRHITDCVNSCSHTDIARALYVKYGAEFKCASISYNMWYRYKDHRWKLIDQGVDLSMKISEDTAGSIIYNLNLNYQELSRQYSNTTDQGQRALLTVRMKQVQKLISSLKSAPFKKNVMKECMEIFYDQQFSKKIDKNPLIIGFKNGIYDLKEHVFRAGIPEDYISLQMPIEYKLFKETDKEVKNIHDFFEKIFPDRSIRDYFIDISSEVFIGGNRRKHVYFWSGEGDNGKSVTQLIFEKMLGEYAIKLPTSLIVGKRTQSSAACPELARAGNGVRWAVLQEPDKKDIINIGILKELSGNDTFFARGLYKEGSEIEPMLKLVVICNDPPLIPNSDRATWNRIRVIPFESTFCDNPPELPEQQLLEKRFAKDPYFDEKIPGMIEALAWVLLNYRRKHYKIIDANGNSKERVVEDPDKVKLATDYYRKKNDIYRQFIDECIVENAPENNSLNISEIFSMFKEWHKESMPNMTMPVKNDVKEYLMRNWGEPSKGCAWNGKNPRVKVSHDNTPSDQFKAPI